MVRYDWKNMVLLLIGLIRGIPRERGIPSQGPATAGKV